MTIPWFLLARIGAASVLGGAIGYERDRHGRPAGLRTHMIVALASATFMVVSTHFIEHQHYAAGAPVNVDVSRIAASIVTGIGFLGGGAIMRNGISIQGLTTAAGLWLVGAIGMAAGSGMYVVAVFVTVLGLLALGLLRRFEDKETDARAHRLELVLAADGSTRVVEQRLTQLGVRFVPVGLRHDRAEAVLESEYELRLPATLTPGVVVETLRDLPGLQSAHVEVRRP